MGSEHPDDTDPDTVGPETAHAESITPHDTRSEATGATAHADATGEVSVVGRVVLRVPTLVLARRNLSRARVRTALAVAAVVVGVVAIGGVGLGGDAFTRSQTQAFAGFGGTADVFPAERATFTDTQLARIEQVAGTARVIPITSGNAVVESRTESQPAQFTRIADPATFYAGETQAGAFPNNWASRDAVVLGSSVAEDLAVGVGDRVTVQFAGGGTESLVVVAVLEPQGFFDPLQADRRLFLSPESDPAYDQVIVQATEESGGIDRVTTDLETTLNARERQVSVVQNQATFDSIRTVLSVASAFVTGVGGVSLLVAVVTIANTMLMAVIEREGEIGVLRAVGYSKRAVVRLLLAESAMIGVIGVAIGVPVAVGVGVLANWALLGEPLAFTLVGAAYVVGGALAGLLASLLAGVYPAWQAANKRPVEAIE